MAARLLAHQVSDLCLGKPPLRSLSISATVGDALSALKTSEESSISVWNCDHSMPRNQGCLCIGKICMVDVICYLSKEENLSSPSSALKAPLSVLLSKIEGLVRHVEPSSSLLEAIDLIVEGAQNLVVPIESRISRRTSSSIHNGQEFCWLTQEDVMRYILSSIGLFPQLSTVSIYSLGIITTNFQTIGYHSAASSISRSLADQTSVAVVDNDGILVGEISHFTLACCDETVAAAIATLSAGDLMAYIDWGGPPEDIARAVEERLKERNLRGMLEETRRSGRHNRSGSYSARMVRRSEAIVCYGGSSLVAVMIQAIAHRVNYVWVIEDDCAVVGIVTFTKMLEVFREYMVSMI